MYRTKSTDPTDRMGIYKRYDEVPDHHRFEHYSDAYDGTDVWTQFCTTHEYKQGSSDNFKRDVDRVGDHWKSHMDGRGRHHALATPGNVESWCQDLVTDKSLSTAYNYWVRIKRFYDWLQWHTEHPHVYDPVLMAVVEGNAAGEIWEQKLRKGRQARERYNDD